VFDYKADADIWAKEQEAILSASPTHAATVREKATLGELLLRYQQEVTPKKDGHKQEFNRINQWLREACASKRIYDVTPKDIALIRDRMVAEGKAASTVKNYINVVSGLYKHAAGEWGYANLVNPVSPIRKPSKEPARDVRLAIGEEEAIWNIPYIDVRATAIFALETSARLAEIVGLERANIFMRSRYAVVHDKVGQKIGEKKRLPLTSRAIEAIEMAQDYFKDPKYVFCNGNIERQCQRISKQWGLHRVEWGLREELWFRDLRHEAISRFVEKGFNAFEIISMTGHRDVAQIQTYMLLREQASFAARLE
jgi:integrase